MNALRLSEIAESLNGALAGDDIAVSQVSTDTRTLTKGALFVALEGPHFNGHDFIPQAIASGASGLLVSEERLEPVAQIRVDNTRLGLGRLAALWRERFPVPLVGITGSNGKTTVKELIAAILSQRGTVLATRGNLNNDIGMPLTLLRLQDEAFAVIEMGANHHGEIDYLTRIARPDVAVLTNAGAAHLEGFGDLVGVARAKGEIFNGLSEDGIAVLNADDRFFDYWRGLLGERQLLSFGGSETADVRGELEQAETRWTEQGFRSLMRVHYQSTAFQVELALGGRHNLMNALAAIAAGLASGCTIEQIQLGLASVRPVDGRLKACRSSAGVQLIDDTYNANPDSVAAAIEVLKKASGNRWLVLGDLAELGDEAVELHARIGRSARAAGLPHLYTLGRLSSHAAEAFGEGARAFTQLEDLVAALKQEATAGDTLLIKGSRSAGMERVVKLLMAEGDA